MDHVPEDPYIAQRDQILKNLKNKKLPTKSLIDLEINIKLLELEYLKIFKSYPDYDFNYDKNDLMANVIIADKEYFKGFIRWYFRT